MPKTEIVYARVSLKTFDNHVRLDESRYEINERLYEVLSDEHYARRLTDTLKEQHPEKLAHWLEYKESFRKPEGYEPIHAVAKFAVTGQEVTFLDIRFE